MTYKIGIDGGGTKTECILVDESGSIVARHLAPGCNPSIVGPDAARRIVSDALEVLVSAFRLPTSAFLICAAGSRAFWQEFANSLTGFGRVTATDDSLPILELATDGGTGLVLHSGTGSFVAARTAAKAPSESSVHYAGGLGWQFGDPGSGYDLGRRAIARTLVEMQGWAAPSSLGEIVRSDTGLTGADAILRHFYTSPAPNPEIAALAPAVLSLAAKGDPPARALVLHSASGLLDLAISVAGKLFPNAAPGSVRAGLSGPILTHPLVMEAFAVRSSFAFKPIDSPPIEGVRRMLARL